MSDKTVTADDIAKARKLLEGCADGAAAVWREPGPATSAERRRREQALIDDEVERRVGAYIAQSERLAKQVEALRANPGRYMYVRMIRRCFGTGLNVMSTEDREFWRALADLLEGT